MCQPQRCKIAQMSQQPTTRGGHNKQPIGPGAYPIS